ncbi:hypothetical protein UlMin_008350 [Ulmus minor]
MEITEEQRKRAEANRLAALAKRKALIESSNGQHRHPWTLFKCQKLSREVNPANCSINQTRDSGPIYPVSNTHSSDKFRVRLEICSADSFSVTPLAIRGFPFPGEEECLRRLNDCLSNVMPSHYTQNHSGGKACVYKVRDYGSVLRCLKSNKNFDVEEIPWGTLNVVESLSHSFISGRWIPCRPEHLLDDQVDELIGKLPKMLLNQLLPFQLEGIKFSLQRGGRCLIADEMGLGKTLQAIAIACCFMNEGSILVVCPAILRFSWAEEFERWVPSCLPADIHLVFGHQNNPAHLKRFPKVVVISYTMLHRLRKTMLEREWALLIVDESHHVRCTKKSEPGETKAVLDMATKVKRIVLLSGTPSLSRPFDIFHQINMLWPGLLGKTKFEFAKTYCDVKFIQGFEGKVFQDFSRGSRLEELNVLLKQTVMIRRLKEHVMLQLPPKRRQIIRVLLKRSDLVSARAAIRQLNDDESNAPEDVSSKNSDDSDDDDCHTSEQLSFHELGIAKLSSFREWLSVHLLTAESDGATNLDSNSSSHKMIIFAHHHKVLDGVQEFICGKGIGFVRIDGSTLARDRQHAVLSFRSSTEVKIALIGITAGGVGLDFSSAQHVVFLELPQSPSLMLQAEDRAHRRGQKNAVNVYIFCAQDTQDESRWKYLNKSLRRVSSTTDGKYDAMQEIEVEGVSFLETFHKNDGTEDQILGNTELGELSPEPLKFQEPGLVKDRKPPEVYNDSAPNIRHGYEDKSNIENSSSETYRFTETAGDATIEVDKGSVSEGTVKGKFSVSETGKADTNEENLLHPQTTELHDAGAHDTEADQCFSKQVNSLRFEVSQYTGRIHLYSCILGADSRPRPLFENFRTDELESLDSSVGDDKKEMAFNSSNPAFRNAILAFSKEWNSLRPIEQKKLLGKPLQLPLTVELCYLNEGINHNNGGLLKVGSKRRHTPLYEISKPLPSNAVWKKVRLRTGCGKKEKEYSQGWTMTDEPLCKLCQTPCKSSNSRTPEFFEDLFCNLECYEEYRLRTSNRFLRQELFQLENGICANCRLDCHQLVECIRPLSLPKRREYVEKVAPSIAMRKKLLDKLVNDPTEGNSWHADHIIPVYRGGGECRLENMRTLCVACHYDVTKAQCAERRAARVKAKKQLKAVMNALKNVQDTEKTNTHTKEQGNLEMLENTDEDDLLVKVPGSAYSSGNNLDTGSEKLLGSTINEEIPASTSTT